MITAQQLAAGLRAFAASLDGMGADAAAPPPPTLVYSPPPPPPSQPQLGAVSVTGDQLTALIQPHVGNEAIKAALGVAMRENGVANLPEAQPHQYATLYAAFQAVLARFGIGGPAPAPGASTSII